MGQEFDQALRAIRLPEKVWQVVVELQRRASGGEVRASEGDVGVGAVLVSASDASGAHPGASVFPPLDAVGRAGRDLQQSMFDFRRGRRFGEDSRRAARKFEPFPVHEASVVARLFVGSSYPEIEGRLPVVHHLACCALTQPTKGCLSARGLLTVVSRTLRESVGVVVSRDASVAGDVLERDVKEGVSLQYYIEGLSNADDACGARGRGWALEKSEGGVAVREDADVADDGEVEAAGRNQSGDHCLKGVEFGIGRVSARAGWVGDGAVGDFLARKVPSYTIA